MSFLLTAAVLALAAGAVVALWASGQFDRHQIEGDETGRLPALGDALNRQDGAR